MNLSVGIVPWPVRVRFEADTDCNVLVPVILSLPPPRRFEVDTLLPMMLPEAVR